MVLQKINEVVRPSSIVDLMTMCNPNLATFFSDRVVTVEGRSGESSPHLHAVLIEENLMGIRAIDFGIIPINDSPVVAPRRHSS